MFYDVPHSSGEVMHRSMTAMDYMPYCRIDNCRVGPFAGAGEVMIASGNLERHERSSRNRHEKETRHN